jgi:pyruvate dehydrogenase E2 component (dihydrolipoamide acetyltransferase)
MSFDFILPDLGEGIAEAEIRKWLVKEGDVIEEHQAVVEVETDKAVVEVPSPKKGTVLKLAKAEGDTAKVGEALMVIGEPGEKLGAPRVQEKKPETEERPKSVSVVGVLPEEEETVVLAAPAVRAFAKEQGASLEKIKGSGPGGSITKEDVLRASKQPPKTADQYGAVERIPIKGVRKAISKNLLFAQKTMASVTEMDEADITELWNLREREKMTLQGKGVHLTFVPFFIKAVQQALKEHTTFNASVDEDREELIIKKYFNCGVAVDTSEGLIVPVVGNADKKTILALAAELQDLSRKARDRTLKLEDMKGSTFTITNYGTYGAAFATPIINYPDVAVLGTGRITDKPWVKGGRVVVRKILPLSLTFDHRVNDGAGAAKFLARLVGFLEDPAALFIESA